MDAIAAMFSRNFPAPTTAIARQEGAKHVGAFVRRYPQLARLLQYAETQITFQGQPAHAAAIPVNSELGAILRAFSARMGMALYRAHVGTPVPRLHRVFASWHPNASLDEDEGIEQLLRAMGHVQTLSQGRWHVAEQFRYWCAVAEDAPNHFVCFAAFRQSFGTLAAIRPVEEQDDDFADYMFCPGFLQGLQVG